MKQGKIEERGRYYVLPIEGRKVSKLKFDGLIKMHFEDDVECYLEIHGPFLISQFGKSATFQPHDKAAWFAIMDLFGIKAVKAQADNYGVLFLSFESKLELKVEDGPYENWHFTRLDSEKGNIYLHGGVGTTY